MNYVLVIGKKVKKLYKEKLMKRLEKDLSAVRDLNINLSRSLEKDLLPKETVDMIVYALGYLLKDEEIKNLRSVSEDKKGEIESAVIIMNMLNVYYKTKFSLDSKDEYVKADLRMQTLANTKLEKSVFEAIAFAVSAVNGCPYCVNSHEKVLRQHGYSSDQVHEVLRISSILKALNSV
jgi:alkyl hydroperoxide reductase subunit D